MHIGLGECWGETLARVRNRIREPDPEMVRGENKSSDGACLLWVKS